MWGGIWFTSLTPHTFLIPWVEQCITKRVCVVNLWGRQPGCACRRGADDFPVLLWGITLTGQQGCWMVHKFTAAGRETGRRCGKDCAMVALKLPDLWVTAFFFFFWLWGSKLKLQLLQVGFFFHYFLSNSPQQPFITFMEWDSLNQLLTFCLCVSKHVTLNHSLLLSVNL